ncbi:hypothetical protein GQ53DRAFT_743219 [Thozetella sp. PMI_491]|nr:hypothetical protein GQ53DRAFT_743219 [Thozetella sp. PMI_491]
MSQQHSMDLKPSKSLLGRSMQLVHAIGHYAWLRKYQLEVTFGVYVYSPAERFVFYIVTSLLTWLLVHLALRCLSPVVMVLYTWVLMPFVGTLKDSLVIALNDRPSNGTIFIDI